jgi:N-methylhydantoinase A/oxoprolinase/acetone carboxylase beta subunit
MKGLEIKSVVVAGVFSPIDGAFYQEDRVQELVLLREMPGVDVVCSHRVCQTGA